MSSRDKWYVITQSTGERYDECVNYSEARDYADGMHMWANRTEHYQVFVDDGKGPPTMMYDVIEGDVPAAVASHDGDTPR